MKHQIKQAGGFTMIELMVAMTIFLIMSLAIFGVLSTNEGQKRTTTSVNDIDQAGDYALYRLGNLLRSAGAGLTQAYQQTYGCRINEVEGGTTILPIASNTLPAPFTGVYQVTGSPRVAPVLIVKAASTEPVSPNFSDVIIVMSSTAGYAQTGISSTSAPILSTLNPLTSITLLPNDLLLLSDAQNATGMAPCLVEQIAPASSYTAGAQPVPLQGTFATTSGADQNLDSYSGISTTIDLGNITGTPSNAPNFLMLGVGPDESNPNAVTSALYSYDILQLAGAKTPPSLLADGVVEIHALYGLDTNGDGAVDTWQDPGTSPYDAATLMNGSAASNTNLLHIKAIRIGLILRTSLLEKPLVENGISAPVSPSTISLFTDLPTLTYTRQLTAAEQNYRWRTFDTTIALRNPLYLDK